VSRPRHPEIASAVSELSAKRFLEEPARTRLARIAVGDLLSIRPEIHVLLYAGVLLLTAAAGLFLKAHSRDIGPVAIAGALTIASAACFGYAFRKAPPFSWGKVEAPSVAFDYVVLLAVLLLGSDLAYLESQFRLLGPNWEYHLLLMSLVGLAVAYRFDSAAVVSLAISSFAAWRGISTRLSLPLIFGDVSARLRANSVFCGTLFLVGAVASARLRKKPHFEAIWGHLGALLLFGGLLAGVFGEGSPGWWGWEAALVAASVVTGLVSFRIRRPGYFAEAVLAGYGGGLRVLFALVHDSGAAFSLLVAGSAAAVAMALAVVWKRLRESHEG
jgi:hypothetical protein